MLDRKTMLDYLNQGAFEDLFIEELGWDEALIPPLDVEVDGATYLLRPVAQKRGLTVLKLQHDPIPLSATRRKIETQVAKRFREHIIIFVNEDNREQIWQWAYREQGRPLQIRKQHYQRGQSGEALRQKLERIRFTLEQEEDLDLIDVVGQVRAAFNVERATRKFFREFKKQHDAFQKFIQGIPDKDMESWYVSVMLNRLMFIYFIQKKGFLDGNMDYLRDKLQKSQWIEQDRYYQDFLCPLFFEGFAKPESQRDPSLKKLLGKVPYLNGGIFQRHQIEQLYGKAIHIPDRAFQQLFDFFDRYQWHLDDRPLRNDNEINPDVLGYIFEQYVNQKEMGAYYTKEDITEYISKNTIIPFLFESAKKQGKIKDKDAFWKLLRDDPDRYIYDTLKKGTHLPLPPEIEAGLEDVGKRDKWNMPTPEEFGLPTEIWRETVARRQRYDEIRKKLSQGDVRDIDELVTLNLDIRQFIQDVIERTEDPNVVRAFWKAVTSVSILDPTCGSGAFLFAALNILEPIYEACLDRMRQFLDELSPHASPQEFSDFRKTLDEIERHPNEQYFILKRIMVDNLYGVDIMEEAIEIAKLRLFLKLVALIDNVRNLEPLPDIDFNIRTGNSLVGFTSLAEMEEVFLSTTDSQTRLLLLDEERAQLEEIQEEAESINRLFQKFRMAQKSNTREIEDASETKTSLRQRLESLSETLNQLLAKLYKVNPKKSEYDAWVKSHQPFHWFTEFYGIISNGGFDIAIGNPPYVEYSAIKKQYTILNYVTKPCGNLYAFTLERCCNILQNNGRMGMIVQLPIVCTDRMIPLQEYCLQKNRRLWFANFDDRPGKLFDGLEHIRATIALAKRKNIRTNKIVDATSYMRWYSRMRPYLFSLLQFYDVVDMIQPGVIPKIGQEVGANILNKMKHFPAMGTSMTRTSSHIVYFHNAPQYWIRAMNFEPYFWNERDGEKLSTQIKAIYFKSRLESKVVTAILNSSLFYWWFIIRSDGRHLNKREIVNFPIGLPAMDESTKRTLAYLTHKLMDDFKSHAKRKTAYYKTTGRVEYDEFYPRFSKHIIDEIDRQLAIHYGFTSEELDFIINYDIKFRMGESLFNKNNFNSFSA